MDRREHLKILLAGGVGAGLFLGTSCTTEDQEVSRRMITESGFNYGRTDAEKALDEKLTSDQFFTEDEYQMVEILSDIIIPADEESGSATEAGVPDFIEFMMKDYPPFQLVTRGGLMWLNNQCNKRFSKSFIECSESERLEVIDDIAWPETAEENMKFGVRFFNRMRDLVSTGFFTSQMGVEYLGYQGNTPGFWDGVPQEVLDKHGFSYEEEMMDKYIKNEDRYRLAEWDGNANLT